MSENRDILAGVILDRQIWSGDAVRNLRSGEAFMAELEEVADIELNTELGRDARENITVHVSNIAAASGCQLNDQLQVCLYGQPVKLQILRRTNNPTSAQVDFGCMKMVEGKDA